MERSGYDRRKRPIAELSSDHRLRTSNEYRLPNHFQQQPLQHPMKPNTSSGLGLNPSNIDYRGYTTPVQQYQSPRTPDTPYIGGSRYTPYDVPAPYAKSTLGDHRLKPRYAREVSEPLDKSITPKVSWQYEIPDQHPANQICEKYERPMDPKEFKEQCRKAYLQNAQDRKRNAELSVWGKCDWASFEKCHDKHRR